MIWFAISKLLTVAKAHLADAESKSLLLWICIKAAGGTWDHDGEHGVDFIVRRETPELSGAISLLG